MVQESSKLIEPYAVCCVQAYFNNYNPNIRREFPETLKTQNLKVMSDYIDACFYVGANQGGIKLICFPEFSIGGLYNPRTTTEEVKKHEAITIPGPETELLAAKAREHRVYIAACNHENDPQLPDFFFNTAFIINPEGKIILKYRKLNAAYACSPHDIMSEYINPITKTRDFFPVVDTSIGRLACFICGDLGIPEIPRIYALKGAEVLLHLSSGYSWELAQQIMRVRAVDNTIYMVNENWAARILTTTKIGDIDVVTSIDSRGGGGSMVIDYDGNVIAHADGTAPQLVMGQIDIMSLRQERQGWKRPNPLNPGGNFLAYTRTELYAPFYARTIFPPDQVIKEGPMSRQNDETVTKRRNLALQNLTEFYDFYSENDI